MELGESSNYPGSGATVSIISDFCAEDRLQCSEKRRYLVRRGLDTSRCPGCGAAFGHGASYVREIHIEILRAKPGTPEHTIRARLSEAVTDGVLSRLDRGFYDVYAEDEDMTSVVSYPTRCSLWGDSRFRGNCDGRLFKNLVLRYGAHTVADPMSGSGTTRDVIEGLNTYKKKGIRYWGADLKEGFDLTKQDLPGQFQFIWIHPPYWNIIRYSDGLGDLSSCDDYEQFRDMLMVCLKRCYDALVPGGRLAVLIGDVRRQGRYTAIIKDVLNFPYGEIRSVIIKVQHNCTSDRKQYGRMEDPPIRHEYLVVFRKAAKAAQEQALPQRLTQGARREGLADLPPTCGRSRSTVQGLPNSVGSA